MTTTTDEGNAMTTKIINKQQKYRLRDPAGWERIRSPEFQYIYDDEERVGTSNYRGVAYFWSYAYRFILRGDIFYWFEPNIEGMTESRSGAIISQMRRSIHRDFLRCGLELDGESDVHAAIIKYHHIIAKNKFRIWEEKNDAN